MTSKGKPAVVHCKREPYDTYIGRPGPYGNPFTIGRDGTREEVIAKYRAWISDQPELLARKEEEALRAMAVLGAVTVEFARLPDMRLSMLPPAEVNRRVEHAVRAQSPDWVLVHHEGDLNRDHAIAHEAARVACRPRNGFLPQLLAYETLSSTEWGTGSFQPNTFVTLESVDLEKKIAAFHEYGLENRPSPHPRSVEAIEALARLRGVQAGVERAEAFRLVWQRV